MVAEPTAEADRGRHPGFPSFNVLAGGLGSLSLALPTATGAAAHDKSRLGYRGTRAAGEPRNRMESHPPTAKTGLLSFDTILTVLERLVRLARVRRSQTRWARWRVSESASWRNGIEDTAIPAGCQR